MRELLPEGQPHDFECGIINLGSLFSDGTHWTCYVKKGDNKIYFDSFGDSPPPKELVNYLGGTNLLYETRRIQEYNDPPICGHLCLEVLRRYSNGEKWESIMNKLSENKYVWTSWWFPL